MKKLLAVLLAMMVMCGAFAVGASAMTRDEYNAKYSELENQYNKWWNDIFYYPQRYIDLESRLRSGKSVEEYKEKERLRSDSWDTLFYQAGFNSGLTGDYESSWRVWQDYIRDEYALLNEYFDVGPMSFEVMELLDGSLICQNKPGDNDPATYTVTYDLKGGTGSFPQQSFTEATPGAGAAVTLYNTAPAKSGYSFKGWDTNPAAATKVYDKGAKFTATANVALYAVWEKDPGTNPDPEPSLIIRIWNAIVKYVFFGWLIALFR